LLSNEAGFLSLSNILPEGFFLILYRIEAFPINKRMNSNLSRLETHESDFTSRLNSSKFYGDEDVENKIFESFPSLPYDDRPPLKEISGN
jgi:hypothetical protein